jgi:hypothetical protein
MGLQVPAKFLPLVGSAAPTAKVAKVIKATEPMSEFAEQRGYSLVGPVVVGVPAVGQVGQALGGEEGEGK